MRIDRAPGEARRRVPELLLTLAVLGGVVDVAIRFHRDGKLPVPFVFDTNDTFMDWFNTAFWAHNRGAFDNWRTVYPPLSFVFLRIFGVAGCYKESGFVARDCDWIGIGAILGWYLLGSAIAALAFWRADPRTAPFRGISFALGLPWLFTLERGNLILPCLTFFVLAHGGIARSPMLRALATAATINFKPYLVLPTLAWAIRRRWRPLELAGIMSVLVYLVTYAILGDGTPWQLYGNTLNFVQFVNGMVYEFVLYSTSYGPFLEFNTPNFPARDFAPSGLVDAMVFWIPIIIHATQALALLVIVGAWLQPRALAASRLTLLILTVYLIGQSPGGYAETFIVFLLFLERWERPGPIVALVMGYLLSMCYDLPLGNFAVLNNTSWLAGRSVVAPVGMAIGMFVRPGLIVVMFWAVALDSLLLIARAHRGNRPVLGLAPASVAVRAA